MQSMRQTTMDEHSYQFSVRLYKQMTHHRHQSIRQLLLKFFSLDELSIVSSLPVSLFDSLPNINVGLAINTTPAKENTEQIASSIEYFSCNNTNAKNAVTIGTKKVNATASERLKYCNEKYIPKHQKSYQAS